MTNLVLFIGWENNQFVFHTIWDWFIFIGLMFLAAHLLTKFVDYMSKH